MTSTQTTFLTGMTPTVSASMMGSTLDTIEVTGTAAGDGIIVTAGEGRPASLELRAKLVLARSCA